MSLLPLLIMTTCCPLQFTETSDMFPFSCRRGLWHLIAFTQRVLTQTHYANLDILQFWFPKTTSLQNRVIVNTQGVHFSFKYMSNDSLKNPFIHERQTCHKNNHQPRHVQNQVIKMEMDKRNGTTSGPDTGVIKNRVLNC